MPLSSVTSIISDNTMSRQYQRESFETRVRTGVGAGSLACLRPKLILEDVVKRSCNAVLLGIALDCFQLNERLEVVVDLEFERGSVVAKRLDKICVMRRVSTKHA